MRIRGLVSRVQGSGFRVQASGFGVYGARVASDLAPPSFRLREVLSPPPPPPPVPSTPPPPLHCAPSPPSLAGGPITPPPLSSPDVPSALGPTVGPSKAWAPSWSRGALSRRCAGPPLDMYACLVPPGTLTQVPAKNLVDPTRRGKESATHKYSERQYTGTTNCLGQPEHNVRAHRHTVQWM